MKLLSKNGLALQFVKAPTLGICLKAIEQDDLALEFVDR
jgi:hypothetical protein